MRDERDMLTLMGVVFAGIGVIASLIMVTVFMAAPVPGVTWAALMAPAVFLFVGGGFLVKRRHDKALESRLRANGRQILGTVRGFVDSSYYVNNERLQKMIVTGDDGKRYLSGPIRLMKTDFEIDDRLTIFIDPADPKKYYVDISEAGPQDLPRGNHFPQLPPS